MPTRAQGMERLERLATDNARSIASQQAVLEQNSEAILLLQSGMTSLVTQMAEISNKLDRINQERGSSLDHRLVRTGRIDFPKFNGEEVEGWVIRCNHFFKVDNTPEEAKVQIAVINLEGYQVTPNIRVGESVATTLQLVTTRFSFILLSN